MMSAQRIERETVDKPSGPKPGGYQATDEVPVLDLVHLSCQTFGDPALEREVLRLFVDQARQTGDALQHARSDDERLRLCHLLKGSARGVGAMEVAQAAQNGEHDPANHGAMEAITASVARVSVHVDQLLGPR